MFDQNPRTFEVKCADNAQLKRPGFRSFKTKMPILYPCRWHRDVLIQATLESSISSIEFCDLPHQDERLFGIFVVHGTERRLILAARDRVVPDARQVLPDHILMTRSYILQEPRCSTARTIWSARKLAVPIGDRLRILERLAEAEVGLTLGELTECVKSPDLEPAAVVLALVCAGQADVGFEVGLSPETVIRRRKVPSAQ